MLLHRLFFLKKNIIMKKSVILFFATSLLTVSLTAKDLKGVLVNEKQKPIAGMKLWIKNTMNSVVTGKYGDFHIEQIKESDTIIIAVNKRQDAIIPVAERRTDVLSCWRRKHLP
jgi:hypothetical protein